MSKNTHQNGLETSENWFSPRINFKIILHIPVLSQCLRSFVLACGHGEAAGERIGGSRL
jgi:hypothetical protein